MSRALLQQALDALIDQKDNITSLMQVEDAITAIREYLDKTKEQEPVCWINMTGLENPKNDTFIVRRHNIPPHMVPLYLHQKGDE